MLGAEDPRPTWGLNLFDLLVICEVLSNETEILDYCLRRIDGTYDTEEARVEGDERDFLVFYIAANLRFDGFTAMGALPTTGFRTELDPFYLNPLSGKRQRRVSRKYTPFWQQIIDFVKKHDPTYWPESVVGLLSLAEKEQTDFEEKLQKSDHDTVVGRRIDTRGWKESWWFGMVKTRKRDDPNRLSRVENVARRAFDKEGTDEGILIVVQGLKPVHALVLTRRENPSWL